METFWQDIRHGLRVLRKSPGFSAVAVLSLALGIGANTTIFTVVNAILLHPLPVKDISQLVELDTIDTKTKVGFANATKIGMSFPNFQDYQKQTEVFSALSCIVPVPLTWSGGSEPRQVNGQLVSANYFDALGLRPVAGRFFLPDEDTKLNGNNVAVISHSFWVNRLGSDPAVVGKSLTLNAMPYTVVGVTPKGFKGTFTFAGAEQIWIPSSMYPQVLAGLNKEFFNDRRFLGIFSVGRLKPGVGQESAEALLKTMASRLEAEYPKDNGGRSVVLTPLADAAVGANQHDQVALAGTMMMTVVGVVLLIACVNLANLLLARAAQREREMGLRAALGASRHRLMRQMLTECILLSLLGGAVGLAIAYVGRSVLWSFRPPFIQQNDLDLSLDSHVLLFTMGISLLTGVLFGVAPALKASVPNVMETQTGRARRIDRKEQFAQPAGCFRNRAFAGGAGRRRALYPQHARRAADRSRFRIEESVHDGIRSRRAALPGGTSAGILSRGCRTREFDARRKIRDDRFKLSPRRRFRENGFSRGRGRNDRVSRDLDATRRYHFRIFRCS